MDDYDFLKSKEGIESYNIIQGVFYVTSNIPEYDDAV